MIPVTNQQYCKTCCLMPSEQALACCWTQGHLDADLPVALVSLERLGPLLDNLGLGQGLHHLD